MIRLSSLGDILHAVPALRSLRTAFPAARIDWLVEEEMQFVLAAVPGIDEVLAIDSRKWRRMPWSPDPLRRFVRLIKRLRSQRYDIVLDFQGLLKTGLLCLLSGARRRIGFDRALVREPPAHWFYHKTVRDPGNPVHVTQLNVALAGEAGGAPVSWNEPLGVTPFDARSVESRLAEKQLSDYVIINPGGGWATKRWHPRRYGELAKRIQEEMGLSVIVTTGPGEDHMFDEIASFEGGSQLQHFQLPFLQLIPLYLGARLFIGGDTGPYHLACAVGTPVVGIFGPTSPVRNGPISERDESVFRVLHCSFCYGRTCPTQNECMDITVDEVYRAVQRRMGTFRHAARSEGQ